MLVPAHVEDGDSEGPLAAALGVQLLDVAEPADQLLAGDALPVGVLVPLPDQPQLVGQEVGVRSESGHAAHLQVRPRLTPYTDEGDQDIKLHGTHHIVIQFVDLLGVEHLVQQLVGVPPLRGEHDAVVGEDAETRARVPDGLHGVLHLVQPPLGREDGGPGVVSTRHPDAAVLVSVII